MRTAFIHIGTMKTGTSTVQEFLRINNKSLYHYEKIHYLGWPMRTSKDILMALNKTPEDASIIISDEGLWHFSFSERSQTSEIVELLKSKGYAIKVIVYFRRPDQFIESWFLQGLKFGTGTALIQDFYNSQFVRSGLALNYKLNKFAEICDKKNIIVRPFERSQLVGSDILDDFCELIHIDVSKFVRPDSENLTANPNAILLGRLLKDSCNIQESESLSKMALSILNAMPKSKGSILTIKEIEFIYDKYMNVYRNVQRHFAPHLPSKIIEKWVDPSEIKYLDNSIRDFYETYIIKTQKNKNTFSKLLEDDCLRKSNLLLKTLKKHGKEFIKNPTFGVKSKHLIEFLISDQDIRTVLFNLAQKEGNYKLINCIAYPKDTLTENISLSISNSNVNVSGKLRSKYVDGLCLLRDYLLLNFTDENHIHGAKLISIASFSYTLKHKILELLLSKDDLLSLFYEKESSLKEHTCLLETNRIETSNFFVSQLDKFLTSKEKEELLKIIRLNDIYENCTSLLKLIVDDLKNNKWDFSSLYKKNNKHWEKYIRENIKSKRKYPKAYSSQSKPLVKYAFNIEKRLIQNEPFKALLVKLRKYNIPDMVFYKNVLMHNPNWNPEKDNVDNYFLICSDPKKPKEYILSDYYKLKKLQQVVLLSGGIINLKSIVTLLKLHIYSSFDVTKMSKTQFQKSILKKGLSKYEINRIYNNSIIINKAVHLELLLYKKSYSLVSEVIGVVKNILSNSSHKHDGKMELLEWLINDLQLNEVFIALTLDTLNLSLSKTLTLSKNQIKFKITSFSNDRKIFFSDDIKEKYATSLIIIRNHLLLNTFDDDEFYDAKLIEFSTLSSQKKSDLLDVILEGDGLKPLLLGCAKEGYKQKELNVNNNEINELKEILKISNMFKNFIPLLSLVIPIIRNQESGMNDFLNKSARQWEQYINTHINKDLHFPNVHKNDKNSLIKFISEIQNNIINAYPIENIRLKILKLKVPNIKFYNKTLINNPEWNPEKDKASEYFTLREKPKKAIELTTRGLERITHFQRSIVLSGGVNNLKVLSAILSWNGKFQFTQQLISCGIKTSEINQVYERAKISNDGIYLEKDIWERANILSKEARKYANKLIKENCDKRDVKNIYWFLESKKLNEVFVALSNFESNSKIEQSLTLSSNQIAKMIRKCIERKRIKILKRDVSKIVSVLITIRNYLLFNVIDDDSFYDAKLINISSLSKNKKHDLLEIVLEKGSLNFLIKNNMLNLYLTSKSEPFTESEIDEIKIILQWDDALKHFPPLLSIIITRLRKCSWSENQFLAMDKDNWIDLINSFIGSHQKYPRTYLNCDSPMDDYVTDIINLVENINRFSTLVAKLGRLEVKESDFYVGVVKNNPGWDIEKESVTGFFKVSKEPSNSNEMSPKNFGKLQKLQRSILLADGLKNIKIVNALMLAGYTSSDSIIWDGKNNFEHKISQYGIVKDEFECIFNRAIKKQDNLISAIS